MFVGERHEISWNVANVKYFDSRIAQCENEMQRITHLQRLATQLPNAFTYAIKIIKSIYQLLILQ